MARHYESGSLEVRRLKRISGLRLRGEIQKQEAKEQAMRAEEETMDENGNTYPAVKSKTQADLMRENAKIANMQRMQGLQAKADEAYKTIMSVIEAESRKGLYSVKAEILYAGRDTNPYVVSEVGELLVAMLQDSKNGFIATRPNRGEKVLCISWPMNVQEPVREKYENQLGWPNG